MKKAETVADTMIDLMKRVHSICTITLDNGGEFASHAKVSAAINAVIYFAKPYASYQRGTNENTNGIIRRRWPKKMTLGHLTEDDLRDMELLINTIPRKVPGGLTPYEVYTGHSIALRNCTEITSVFYEPPNPVRAEPVEVRWHPPSTGSG